MRGIAAIAVFFFHATMFRPQAKFGFFLGITGVDLFFMISGFVILMSIENKKSGKAFVISRFIRIYPIYWVIASFTFSYYFILNYFNSPLPYVEISLSNYLVNLTMIQYFFDVPNIDGSYWTLIIELLFYILIYILHRLKLLYNIVKIGLIILTLSTVNFYLVTMGFIPDYSDWLPILHHFPLFYIGILFYKIFKKNRSLLSVIPHIIYALAIQISLHPYGRSTKFMSIEWYAMENSDKVSQSCRIKVNRLNEVL